jgi:hypothetical protein
MNAAGIRLCVLIRALLHYSLLINPQFHCQSSWLKYSTLVNYLIGYLEVHVHSGIKIL